VTWTNHVWVINQHFHKKNFFFHLQIAVVVVKISKCNSFNIALLFTATTAKCNCIYTRTWWPVRENMFCVRLLVLTAPDRYQKRLFTGTVEIADGSVVGLTWVVIVYSGPDRSKSGSLWNYANSGSTMWYWNGSNYLTKLKWLVPINEHTHGVPWNRAINRSEQNSFRCAVWVFTSKSAVNPVIQRPIDMFLL
jgi:hypothetical protein